MSRWDSTCGNGKDMLRPTPCARAGRGRTKGRKSMPEYRENELCYEDYRALRTLAGWETHSEEQTRRALAAALYDVTAVEDGRAGIPGARHWKGCGRKASGLCPKPAASGRTHERTAYCGRRQGGLLRKAGLSENAGRGLRLCAAACAARTPGGIRKRPCPAACSRPERGRFAFAVWFLHTEAVSSGPYRSNSSSQ